MRTFILSALAAALPLAGFAAAPAGDLPPLNAPATSESHPGKFVWADLFTVDPGAAEQFYTGLFGWTASSIERNGKVYRALYNDGRPVAGIVLRPSKVRGHKGGRWIPFISVSDVGRAVDAFKSAGGRVVFPVKDLPDRGVQAIVADPEGALLGVVRSSTGDPGEYRADPGDWVWEELFERTTTTASAFYRDALGYQIFNDDRIDRADAFILASGGYSRASLMPLPAKAGAYPDWLPFVCVADIDATVAKAAQLGGRILVQPEKTMPDTRIAIIADPMGAAIGVTQLIEQPADQPADLPTTTPAKTEPGATAP